MPARYAPARYARRPTCPRATRADMPARYARADMPARYARTDFNQLMLIP